jgi:hygromycin-B 7''-O-kinase
MTTTIYFSSNRLGEVTHEQLQRVLDRFDLGRLLSFGRTAEGVMGQTLYISSTAGQFVLKGNPLFSGQWVEERYMVEQLHTRTSIPVPAPYLVDDTEDIFGWSYAVMPRLYGEHIHTPELQAKLTSRDKQQIAEILAGGCPKILGHFCKGYGMGRGNIGRLTSSIRSTGSCQLCDGRF